MIISSISDGLGNQLFQYAFGRTLAKRHNVPLKLNPYWFKHAVNSTYRSYALSHFAIEAPEATWQELDEYIHADTWLHRMTRPYYRRIRIRERGWHHDPNVRRFPAHTFVEGYWQSWTYYAGHHDLLRQDLQIITPPSNPAARLLDRISRPNTVAIHIRRGDYVNNPVCTALSPDYYHRAIAYLQERYEDLTWYVFSDDMAWVRQHIDLPASTLLVEGLEAIDDFRLMTASVHSILANSTFSLWTALLKPVGGSLIVAPKVPFTNPAMWSGDEWYPPHFIRC
jgi:hypothetical protein